jgi:molecular chaperone GrpE
MRDPSTPNGDEPTHDVEENAEPASEGEASSDAETDTSPAEAAKTAVDEEPPAVVIELSAEELLQKRLDEAQVRLRTVSKAYTDLQAENASFRERIESQARFKRERQAFDLARGFFDPVQNLKRSLEQGADDPAVLASGLQMVLKQFMGAMEKLGMKEIPGIGTTFDPTVHEALAVTPVLDPEQDGKVLMVHSDGYTVNGKVLVASQVVIGKYQENQGEA